jgi:hypothetical protein
MTDRSCRPVQANCELLARIIYLRVDIHQQKRWKLYSEKYDGLSHTKGVGIYFSMSVMYKDAAGDVN